MPVDAPETDTQKRGFAVGSVVVVGQPRCSRVDNRLFSLTRVEPRNPGNTAAWLFLAAFGGHWLLVSGGAGPKQRGLVRSGRNAARGRSALEHQKHWCLASLEFPHGRGASIACAAARPMARL